MDLETYNYTIERKCCPMCLSTKTKIIYSSPYLEEPILGYLKWFYSFINYNDFLSYLKFEYVLVECQICKLIYQLFVPNDFLLEIIYNKWLGNKLDKKLKNIYSLKKISSEIFTVVDFLRKPHKELHFLDFGAGWGEWSLLAKGYGINVDAVEISENKRKYLENNGIKMLSINNLGSREYDFINTEQVFEHLINPNENMLKLYNALKDGGILKISIPNGYNIKKKIKSENWLKDKTQRNNLNAIAPLEHINTFSLEVFKFIEKSLGLQIIIIPIKIWLSNNIKTNSFLDNLKNMARPLRRNFFSNLSNELYILLKKK